MWMNAPSIDSGILSAHAFAWQNRTGSVNIDGGPFVAMWTPCGENKTAGAAAAVPGSSGQGFGSLRVAVDKG
jgi:hypothetical protein